MRYGLQLDMKSYLVLFDRKAKELTAKSGDLQRIVSESRKILPPLDENDIPAVKMARNPLLRGR